MNKHAANETNDGLSIQVYGILIRSDINVEDLSRAGEDRQSLILGLRLDVLNGGLHCGQATRF
jgi:hypothetical protein